MLALSSVLNHKNTNAKCGKCVDIVVLVWSYPKSDRTACLDR